MPETEPDIRVSSWWAYQPNNDKFTEAVVHLLGFTIDGRIDAVIFVRLPMKVDLERQIQRMNRHEFELLVRNGLMMELPQRSREP